MVQHSRTKDERFVLRLHEIEVQLNEEEHVINRYDVGRSIGLQERGVDTICVLLGQANFIKKAGDKEIFLTKHGKELAIRLLEEK